MAGLLVALVVTGWGTVSSANHGEVADPVPNYDGVRGTGVNDNCQQIYPGSSELRVDPPGDGTFNHADLSVAVDLYGASDTIGERFNFRVVSGPVIIAMAVKGGSTSQIYDYLGQSDFFADVDPPADEAVTADHGAHAPLNDQNGKFHEVSHISFCYLDFTAAVDVTKAGDALGKVTDPVTYTITVTNTSSQNAPGLSGGTIVDTLLGDLSDPDNPLLTGNSCGATLAAGQSCAITAERFVEPGDPDPLVSSVTAAYEVGSTGIVISDTASQETNLFQPAVGVTAGGDGTATVGDLVDYTFTITNQGSADSPNLRNGTVVDSLLGDLLAPANPFVTSSTCAAVLPTGGSCTIEATRVAAAGDPNPLTHSVTVHYNPLGFPNDITDSADHNTMVPTTTTTTTAPTTTDPTTTGESMTTSTTEPDTTVTTGAEPTTSTSGPTTTTTEPPTTTTTSAGEVDSGRAEQNPPLVATPTTAPAGPPPTLGSTNADQPLAIGGELPRTGTGANRMVTTALSLMVAGLILVLVTRRRGAARPQ